MTGKLDSDNDGLPDKEEELWGSNKNAVDSDGDGYSDYDEVRKGYNPAWPGKVSSELAALVEEYKQDYDTEKPTEEEMRAQIERDSREIDRVVGRVKSRSLIPAALRIQLAMLMTPMGLVILFIMLVSYVIGFLIFTAAFHFTCSRVFKIYEATPEKSFQIAFLHAAIMFVAKIAMYFVMFNAVFRFSIAVVSFVLSFVVMHLLLNKFYNTGLPKNPGIAVVALIITLLVNLLIGFAIGAVMMAVMMIFRPVGLMGSPFGI